MRRRASPSASAPERRVRVPAPPCASRPATLGDCTAQPKSQGIAANIHRRHREAAVKSTSQGRAGGCLVGPSPKDAGLAELEVKSLSIGQTRFSGLEIPGGGDFEALLAVPAIGRIPRFWALSNRRRRNRAQAVGFVRQSHSDCALASGSAVGEGGSDRQVTTSRSWTLSDRSLELHLMAERN